MLEAELELGGRRRRRRHEEANVGGSEEIHGDNRLELLEFALDEDGIDLGIVGG